VKSARFVSYVKKPLFKKRNWMKEMTCIQSRTRNENSFTCCE